MKIPSQTPNIQTEIALVQWYARNFPILLRTRLVTRTCMILGGHWIFRSMLLSVMACQKFPRMNHLCHLNRFLPRSREETFSVKSSKLQLARKWNPILSLALCKMFSSRNLSKSLHRGARSKAHLSLIQSYTKSMSDRIRPAFWYPNHQVCYREDHRFTESHLRLSGLLNWQKVCLKCQINLRNLARQVWIVMFKKDLQL